MSMRKALISSVAIVVASCTNAPSTAPVTVGAHFIPPVHSYYEGIGELRSNSIFSYGSDSLCQQSPFELRVRVRGNEATVGVRFLNSKKRIYGIHSTVDDQGAVNASAKFSPSLIGVNLSSDLDFVFNINIKNETAQVKINSNSVASSGCFTNWFALKPIIKHESEGVYHRQSNI